MIEIYSANGTAILNPLITVEAEHEEELMKSDFVSLSWSDADRYVINAGAYIIPYPDDLDLDGNPVRYMLFKDYVPEQIRQGEYSYKPEFQHPKMWLGYVPFLFGTYDAAGNPVKKTEFDYIGPLGTLLQTICDDINNAFGYDTQALRFTLQPVGDAIDMMETVNITFSDDNILSAIQKICNETGYEYHLEWPQRLFYFGSIYLGDAVGEDDDFELEIGRNIDVPKVTSTTEKQYNRFYVQGGTRNNARATEHGNIALNTRLLLDDTEFPGSIIDTRPVAEQSSPGLTGIITLDDVYPHLELYLYDLHERHKYKTDENGKVTAEPWSVWYFKLAYYDNGWHDFILKSDPNTRITEAAQSQEDPVVTTDLPVIDLGLPIERKTEGGIDFEQRVVRVNKGEGVSVKVGVRSGRDNLEFEQYINDDAAGQDSKAFLRDLHVSDRISILTPIDLDALPEENIVTHSIDGLVPSLAFMTNPSGSTTPNANALGTREFEIRYNTTPVSFDAKDDVEGQTGIGAGYYEIIHTTEGSDGLIVPTTSEQGICPYGLETESITASKVQIFNVCLELSNSGQDPFITRAQEELELKAKAEIVRIMADQNHYTANALSVVWEETKPEVKIGRRVRFDDAAGYQIDSRIIRLVTKLDYDFETEITFGNKLTKRFSDTVMAQIAKLGNGTGGYEKIVVTPAAQTVTYVEYPSWIYGTPYYFETINKNTGVLETSYVWHRGKKWMCLRTLTGEEPRLGAADWRVVEGDQTFALRFYDAEEEGYLYGENVLVRRGYVNIPLWPVVMWGTDNVTDMVSSWLWKRSTRIGGEVNWSTERNITVTDQSLPPAWSVTNPAIFTCYATIDGIDITNILTI